MPTDSPAIDLLPQLTSAYNQLLAVKDSFPPASNWYGDCAHRSASERLAIIRSALVGSDIGSIAVSMMRATDAMRALLIQCSPILMEQHKDEARATIDRIHDLAWSAKGEYMRAVSDLLRSIPDNKILRGYSMRRGRASVDPRDGIPIRIRMVKAIDLEQVTDINYGSAYAHNGSVIISVSTPTRTYSIITHR